MIVNNKWPGDSPYIGPSPGLCICRRDEGGGRGAGAGGEREIGE